MVSAAAFVVALATVATSQGLQHNPMRRPVRAHDAKALSDKVDGDCTVVFDAEGAYCAEDEEVAMSKKDAEACQQTDECEVPDKFKNLLERIVQRKKKPRSPGPPKITVIDSEGQYEVNATD
mmetsp:Transcript_29248/g.87481  ORF Transcript_29248/g.87481 Transcript_29248/m.87481 type:complete len:122 (+) Transcript_29248:256-621(+)